MLILNITFLFSLKNDTISLISSCNSACQCNTDALVPVCDNKMRFFSPCHAGCTTQSSSSQVKLSVYHQVITSQVRISVYHHVITSQVKISVYHQVITSQVKKYQYTTKLSLGTQYKRQFYS